MKFRHLFGPVPSRRLGRSLGVDLVPFKTCTLDCVYCECGKTTCLTTERKEYIPVKPVMKELLSFLENHPPLDYITIAGSGEPLLHLHLEEIIHFIKEHFPYYPICLLTNGTLFFQSEVRQQVSSADLIIPSLDAGNENTFQKLNRPHPQIQLKELISGLKALSKEYRGEIQVEVFIVPGINDHEEELSAIKEVLIDIAPQGLQLNTLDRPSSEDWVEEVPLKKIQEIATYLDGAIIANHSTSTIPHPGSVSFHKNTEAILHILQRRPCTIEDLGESLKLNKIEVQKYLRYLKRIGLVETERKKRGIFYRCKNISQEGGKE